MLLNPIISGAPDGFLIMVYYYLNFALKFRYSQPCEMGKSPNFVIGNRLRGERKVVICLPPWNRRINLRLTRRFKVGYQSEIVG